MGDIKAKANNPAFYVDNKKQELLFTSRRISLYIIIMMIGIILSTFVTQSITIAWIINLAGLTVFLPYIRYVNIDSVIISFLYILFGGITVFLNNNFIIGDLKSIGTNVNIFIFPFFLIMTYSLSIRYKFTQLSFINVFQCLSILGVISIVFSWVMGGSDILNVYSGLSAYQAKAAGLFYSKNIYGAFVGLTIGADLYLLNLKSSFNKYNEESIYLLIVGIKIIAVILSFSRAALLQVFVMIFLYLLLGNSKSIHKYILLFFTFIVACGLLAFIHSHENLMTFLLNSVLRIDVGDAGREVAREMAIGKFSDNMLNILFGVGFAGIDVLDIDLDNTYLYLWFTGGIPKILFYIGAILISFRNILFLKKMYNGFFRVCFAVAGSYLFFAFFESVAVLELGLLNFLYTLFMFIIPITLRKNGFIY